MSPPPGQRQRPGPSGRLLPRSTWAPTTAACWSAHPPATASACWTVSPHRPPWRGLHHTGALSQTAMDRALAALTPARRGSPAGRCAGARDCHRGLPPRRQRRGVPGPGQAGDRIGHRRDNRAGGSRTRARNCAPLLPGGGRRALLFDIGGGSTELAWVRTGRRPCRADRYDSLPVGVVKLAERWGDAGFTPDGFTAMVDDVAARLASFERVHCIAPGDPQRWRRSARDLRDGDDAGWRGPGTAALPATAVDGVVLTAEAADAALRLRAMGREELRSIPASGRTGSNSSSPAALFSPRLPGCGRRHG